MRVDIRIVADHCGESRVFEHLYILRLLKLVGYVVDSDGLLLFGLFFLLFCAFGVFGRSFRIYRIFFCGGLAAVLFKAAVFAVDILVDDYVFDFLIEVVILYAAEFNEVGNVAPALFIFCPVGLEERYQLVGNLLGDVL